MESFPSNNRNFKHSLCVIDLFTKYARIKSLKDKKGKTVFHVFIEITNESNLKLKKVWIDEGR